MSGKKLYYYIIFINKNLRYIYIYIYLDKYFSNKIINTLKK